MEKKQTAIQWIIEQLQAPCRGIPSHIIEEALQMEREQHKETWLDSSAQFSSDARMDYPIGFEIYYTQTYER